MDFKKLKQTCLTCAEYISAKVALWAVFLLVLGFTAKGPFEKLVTSAQAMTDWKLFQAEWMLNLAGFLDGPLGRLFFILVGLILLTRSAHSAIKHKDKLAQERLTADGHLLRKQEEIAALPILISKTAELWRDVDAISKAINVAKISIEDCINRNLEFYAQRQILSTNPPRLVVTSPAIPVSLVMDFALPAEPTLIQKWPISLRREGAHAGHDYNPDANIDFLETQQIDIASLRRWMGELDKARVEAEDKAKIVEREMRMALKRYGK